MSTIDIVIDYSDAHFGYIVYEINDKDTLSMKERSHPKSLVVAQELQKEWEELLIRGLVPDWEIL